MRAYRSLKISRLPAPKHTHVYGHHSPRVTPQGVSPNGPSEATRRPLWTLGGRPGLPGNRHKGPRLRPPATALLWAPSTELCPTHLCPKPDNTGSSSQRCPNSAHGSETSRGELVFLLGFCSLLPGQTLMICLLRLVGLTEGYTPAQQPQQSRGVGDGRVLVRREVGIILKQQNTLGPSFRQDSLWPGFPSPSGSGSPRRFLPDANPPLPPASTDPCALRPHLGSGSGGSGSTLPLPAKCTSCPSSDPLPPRSPSWPLGPRCLPGPDAPAPR